MSFKVVAHTLTADVALDATFDVSYPADTDADTFTDGLGHYMMALGSKRLDRDKITISFGASNITITNKGATTLPAGTEVRLHFEIAGTNSQTDEQEFLHNLRGTTFLQPVMIDFGSPVATDDDALIDAATGSELPNASSVTYPFPGSTSPQDNAAGQSGELDWPRNIIASQVGTSVAGTVTITGTDIHDEALVEALTFVGSVSNEALAGKKAFKKVTSIVITSATDMTSITMNVGFGNVLGLPIYLSNQAYIRSILMDGNEIARGGAGYERVPFVIDATAYAAGTSQWVAAPVSGNVIGAEVVVDVQTSGADTITFEIQTSAITGLSLAVGSGATVGTRVTDEIAAIAAGRVEEGELIEIVHTNTPSAGQVSGFLVIQKDNVDDADVVVGETAIASASTGDPRGTIDFKQDLEAATGFRLLLNLPDVDRRLGAQYTA